MKIGKRTIGLSAMMAVLAYSTVAMAAGDDPYCDRMARNWQGTMAEWADWVFMCM